MTRRRENHRNQEQHRREKINENLTQLRALLEPTTMARCNKANILKTCVDYINQLRTTQRQLLESNCILRDKLERLDRDEVLKRKGGELRGVREVGILELENRTLREEITRLRSEVHSGKRRRGGSCSSCSTASVAGPHETTDWSPRRQRPQVRPSASKQTYEGRTTDRREELSAANRGSLSIASLLCTPSDAEVPAAVKRPRHVEIIRPEFEQYQCELPYDHQYWQPLRSLPARIPVS
eukprot:CAMPEP_0196654930 /NCGR_PEP_ID=MMETSP1086-20130531/4672_1 /TAXON_ID=77921 /ORGANISM="Cyanoptyche  gloeocystis , Strain SAG4.97" /LENGTH=238 /DNA_ID=CAMNT_0041986973 /DNA_START=284 /DNA_END=1000 /DNA_ORIENTATION=+